MQRHPPRLGDARLQHDTIVCMNINRLLATAAMTAGLAIGIAANATAAPIGELGDKADF